MTAELSEIQRNKHFAPWHNLASNFLFFCISSEFWEVKDTTRYLWTKQHLLTDITGLANPLKHVRELCQSSDRYSLNSNANYSKNFDKSHTISINFLPEN